MSLDSPDPSAPQVPLAVPPSDPMDSSTTSLTTNVQNLSGIKKRRLSDPIAQSLDDDSGTDRLSRRVRLNVGGIRYETTIGTLSSEPGYFRTMFSGSFDNTPDSNGEFFIDRNGEIFSYILDFLRNKTITVPAQRKRLKDIEREARFFSLDKLLDLVSEHVEFALYPIAPEACGFVQNYGRRYVEPLYGRYPIILVGGEHRINNFVNWDSGVHAWGIEVQVSPEMERWPYQVEIGVKLQYKPIQMHIDATKAPLFGVATTTVTADATIVSGDNTQKEKDSYCIPYGSRRFMVLVNIDESELLVKFDDFQMNNFKIKLPKAKTYVCFPWFMMKSPDLNLGDGQHHQAKDQEFRVVVNLFHVPISDTFAL